jgi:2-oxo-4-hydroxy-4-carboxy-5-ureidoimidazoline decarboxylase
MPAESTWPLPAPTSLAGLDAGELGTALAPLFEEASQLVPALVGRHFVSWSEVIDAAEAAIEEMTDDQRSTVLAAHPCIGLLPAELARRSRASWREQGGDVAPDAEVDARLADLNQRYYDRFGFPFVVHVNGRSRRALVPVLETRLGRRRQAELASGCAAVIAIARDRLNRLQSEP